VEYIEEIYDRSLLIYEVHFQLIDHNLILLSSSYLDPFVQVHENIQLHEKYRLIDPKNKFHSEFDSDNLYLMSESIFFSKSSLSTYTYLCGNLKTSSCDNIFIFKIFFFD
jgi:hypothetical protein